VGGSSDYLSKGLGQSGGMMLSGFDTNDPAVVASLENVLALAETGDESAWTRLADLWSGRFGVGGLSRR